MKIPLLLGGAVLCLVSCSTESAAPAGRTRSPRVSFGDAAKVGNEEIALRTVSRIAEAQGLSLSAARERAIQDALFSAAARETFADNGIPVVVERAALARSLLETFEADASARGSASDAEIDELSALRWQYFDRPESVRTTHAVARVDGSETEAKAKALAQQIWEAVRGVTDPEDFMRLAQAVPHDGVELRAERLPALTRDGRPYYPEGTPPQNLATQRFDQQFSEAAYRLSAGEISAPVKTAFGYHVILCEARLPPFRVPREERRTLLNDEVLKGRAERAKQDLLARLSRATPVSIARAAEDLTAQVRVRE